MAASPARPRAVVAIAAFLVVCGVVAPADARSRVQLLTVARGDALFTTFGHTVLRVIDDEAGTDRVYDWGTYDPGDPWLMPKFFVGELRYHVADPATPVAFRVLQRWFGGVLAQDLALAPAQVDDLLARVADSLLPENRAYRYHYFDDNCTTRVRDLLDAVLGGALSAATRGVPADGDTYRSLIEASMPDAPFVRWAVYGMLNERIDMPVDRWQRMFLPVHLMDELDRLEVPGADGRRAPLVTARTTLSGAAPAAPLPSPSLTPWLLLIAALFGLSLWPALAPRWRPARIWMGAWLAALGLAGGFHGTLQALAWAIAPYAESHANGNLLAVHPLTFALVVLGPRAAMGRRRARRILRAALLAQGAILLVVLGLRAAGVFVQHVEGFAVPVVVASAAAWITLGRLPAR